MGAGSRLALTGEGEGSRSPTNGSLRAAACSAALDPYILPSRCAWKSISKQTNSLPVEKPMTSFYPRLRPSRGVTVIRIYNTSMDIDTGSLVF